MSATVPCNPGFYYDDDGICIPDTSSSSGGLTTAQEIGIGVVIGVFVMAFMLIGIFMCLRKKRGRKNAVLMVMEENQKYSFDAEMMELK